MPNKSPFRSIALAALTVGVFAACSEDEAPPPPLPEGPPDLHVLSLDAPGAHTGFDDAGSGGCFPVGAGSNLACDSSVSGPGCGFVVVLKTINNRIPLELPDGSLPRSWTFQPPLGCQGAPDCGFALLLIDPTTEPCAARPQAAVQKIAAGPVISVDFAELQSRLNGAFGRKTVRVELWPGEGVPDKEHCHHVEVNVDFELTCGQREGGTIDAGSDAADSGAIDASTDAPGPSDASDAARDVARPDASASDAAIDAPKPDASASDGARSDASDGSVESG